MRRIIGILAAVLTVATGFAMPVQAADDLLFGQRHFYSVTLRGNGEAVVTARLVFANQTEQPKTTYTFKAVGIEPTEMVGYQQTIAAGCAQYDQRLSTTLPQPPCLQYSEPDYVAMYPSGTSTYEKLTITTGENGMYSVTLPKSVAPGESTAVLLSYAGKGFVQNQWGRFAFNVQTLEVGERVKQASVAVDVDEGLYMKDPQGKVNYERDTLAQDMAMPANAASGKALDSIAYRLGSYGALTKEANDLAAGETLSATGEYADAAWKLNLVPLGVLTLAVVALALGGVWGWRRWRKARLAMPRTAAEGHAAQPRRVAGNWQNWWFDPAVVGLALMSVLVTAGLTWLFAAWIDSSNSSDNFLVLSGLVLILMAYVVLIFGPAGWLAWRRHDVRVGAVMFVWQVVFMLAVLTAYQLVLVPLFETVAPPPDIMPMSSGSGGVAEDLKAN